MKKTISVFLAVLMVVSLFSVCSFAAGNTLKVGKNSVRDGGVYTFTAETTGVYSFTGETKGEDDWFSISVDYSDDDIETAFCSEDYLHLYYIKKGASCELEIVTDSSEATLNVVSYGKVTNVFVAEEAEPLQNNYDVFCEEDFFEEGVYSYIFEDCIKAELNGSAYTLCEVEVSADGIELVSGENTVAVSVLGGTFDVSFDLINVTDYIKSIDLPADFDPLVVVDGDGYICDYDLQMPETVTAQLTNGTTAELTLDEEDEVYYYTAGEKELVLFPDYTEEDGNVYFEIKDGFFCKSVSFCRFKCRTQLSTDAEEDTDRTAYAWLFTDFFGFSTKTANFLSKVLTVLLEAWFGRFFK